MEQRWPWFVRSMMLTVVLLLAAGCGDNDGVAPPPPAAPGADLEPMRLHADGAWLRDDGGRVVIIRGANYSGLEFGNFVGRS